jgi:DDE superfamily endonuclease
VDLWWSGKHKHHGGNVQVVSAPDGWPLWMPLWTSEVCPGREHDITAARTDPDPDPDLITLITAWVTDGRPGLADLGYAGEPTVFTVPHKKPRNTDLTVDQQTFNTSTAPCAASVNARTRCSRPPTRRSAATAH